MHTKRMTMRTEATIIGKSSEGIQLRKISYDPLWKKRIDLKMTKTELAEKAEISRSTIAKMRRDESVALEIIERICQKLDCEIIDVVSIKKS